MEARHFLGLNSGLPNMLMPGNLSRNLSSGKNKSYLDKISSGDYS